MVDTSHAREQIEWISGREKNDFIRYILQICDKLDYFQENPTIYVEISSKNNDAVEALGSFGIFEKFMGVNHLQACIKADKVVNIWRIIDNSYKSRIEEVSRNTELKEIKIYDNIFTSRDKLGYPPILVDPGDIVYIGDEEVDKKLKEYGLSLSEILNF
ncbi:MAG: hypothetical protein J7K26_04265 [Candidatus Aenigmarchaeota archaeon]|nr:hypothetical protein [Candidatus Aenigmarchaeota archaeon]